MVIRARENVISAWAFLIGLILAIAVGILSASRTKTSPWILGTLALLGLVVGYFVSEKEVKTFLLASVSLVIVSFAGIQGLVLDAAIRGVAIGKFVSSVLSALLVLFVPATIIVVIKTIFSLSNVSSR